MATLSDKTKQQIEKKLEAWCAEKGYKDTAINLLMLSRQLEVSKSDLSLYFDQCLESLHFHIWLSDIRFEAAKKMMREKTSYSNDVISLECGFSSRSQLLSHLQFQGRVQSLRFGVIRGDGWGFFPSFIAINPLYAISNLCK